MGAQNKPDWVLFDLDGTLTDPFEGITGCVQYALEKMGIKSPEKEELKHFIGPPLTDSFMQTFSLTKEEAEQAVAYYRERFSTVGMFENAVYPGIPSLLQQLRAEGISLAVATSKPTVFSVEILKHFGLYDCFDLVVGSELNGHRVEKDQVIAKVLADCGAENQKVMMVGDRHFDVSGAKKCHLPCIGVLYGYGSREELTEAGAVSLAQRVEDLLPLLLGFPGPYSV